LTTWISLLAKVGWVATCQYIDLQQVPYKTKETITPCFFALQQNQRIADIQVGERWNRNHPYLTSYQKHSTLTVHTASKKRFPSQN